MKDTELRRLTDKAAAFDALADFKVKKVECNYGIADDGNWYVILVSLFESDLIAIGYTFDEAVFAAIKKVKRRRQTSILRQRLFGPAGGKK